MILIQATIYYKGYNPNDLKPKSNKRVCVSCDECGRVRWVQKSAYRDLCHKCGIPKGKTHIMYGKKHTEKTKRKISNNHADFSGKNAPNYGKKFSDETKQKMKDNHANFKGENHPMFGKHHSDETKQKMCGKIGENSNNWKGGLSYGKYCSKFNKSLKQSIRNKYNDCDYISGIHKDICNNGRSLDVHHVDYNKQQGCDDVKWKLIPLSRVNHMKTNSNRSFWNRLFTYSLQYEKEYYGDE